MRLPRLVTAAGLALAASAVAPAAAPAVITGATLLPFAGNGASCASPMNVCGDGGPATAAQLETPRGVAVMPDGAIIVADTGTNRIRRVAPNGTITTVAGSGTPCSTPTGACGDNAQGATTAQLTGPQGVAAIDADSFLIADTGNHKIRRVDGFSISTVAGNGDPVFNGDGAGPTTRTLQFPRDVATRDGGATFLIADNGNIRVRRVAGGAMTTVAGDGTSCISGTCGDGGSSTAAQLGGPAGIAVLPGDGFLIAEPTIAQIRRVSSDAGGTIDRVAGQAAAGFGGDGGPATSATLHAPDDVVALPTGGFVLTDTTNHRIRIVNPAGAIDTVAGNGAQCSSGTSACGDGGEASAGSLNEPRGVAVDAKGDLVIADATDDRVRLIRMPPASGSTPGTQDGTTNSSSSPPVVGRSVLVQTLRGRVLVRIPGSSTARPLDELANVPDGSTVDTREGTARLTVARPDGTTDTADLSEGVLQLDQRTNGSLVDLRLTEQITGCPRPVRDSGSDGAQSGVKTVPRKRAATGRAATALLATRLSPLTFAARAHAAAKKRKTRRGRVKADGKFRTDGKYGSAVVRGTQWLVIDDCGRGKRPQTRVIVREGKVGVRDFARARTKLVTKGKRYVAYARRA